MVVDVVGVWDWLVSEGDRIPLAVRGGPLSWPCLSFERFHLRKSSETLDARSPHSLAHLGARKQSIKSLANTAGRVSEGHDRGRQLQGRADRRGLRQRVRSVEGHKRGKKLGSVFTL